MQLRTHLASASSVAFTFEPTFPFFADLRSLTSRSRSAKMACVLCDPSSGPAAPDDIDAGWSSSFGDQGPDIFRVQFVRVQPISVLSQQRSWSS